MEVPAGPYSVRIKSIALPLCQAGFLCVVTIELISTVRDRSPTLWSGSGSQITDFGLGWPVLTYCRAVMSWWWFSNGLGLMLSSG